MKKTNRTKTVLLAAFFSIASLIPTTKAQIVNDGETNTLSGVINAYVGNVTVGTNGSFTRLNIVNGAQLNNSGDGFIGKNHINFDLGSYSSKSNLVVVDGPGSRWDLDDGNTGNGNNKLSVGHEGSYNTLLITNGAVVKDFGASIGYAGSYNQAIVTGSGSQWTNSGELLLGGPDEVVDILLGGIPPSHNALLISDGASVQSSAGSIGARHLAGFNLVTVTGSNSLWRIGNGGYLTVGSSGHVNTLLVTNGGRVDAGFYNAIGSAGNRNQAVITGAGSRWSMTGSLNVGQYGESNALLIANGGNVISPGGSFIGYAATADNNSVTVTGSGSQWTASAIGIGLPLQSQNVKDNALAITDGGTVKAQLVKVGFINKDYGSRTIGSLLQISGGNLVLTNVNPNDGILDVICGSVLFDGGEIAANQLNMTRSHVSYYGSFDFNFGRLAVSTATISNNAVFTVGNGTGVANYQMTGTPASIHSFADGLLITNNATLTGNGTILGEVTVANGGTLAPGNSAGKIVLSNAPVLQGSVVMDISRNGGALTNDQIQMAGTLTYGGSLVVSNLGPDALLAGDSFQLFSASGYSGTFSSITLPPMPPGFRWLNKLSLNGSIEAIGSPIITGITVNGPSLVFNVTGGSPNADWNLLTSTNSALPVPFWITNSSGVFNAAGSVTVTNGINITEPQRFFLFQVP